MFVTERPHQVIDDAELVLREGQRLLRCVPGAQDRRAERERLFIDHFPVKELLAGDLQDIRRACRDHKEDPALAPLRIVEEGIADVRPAAPGQLKGHFPALHTDRKMRFLFRGVGKEDADHIQLPVPVKYVIHVKMHLNSS